MTHFNYLTIKPSPLLAAAALGLIFAAAPPATRAQGNPPVLNGEQRNRQSPLPQEAASKPSLPTKTYAKPIARPASGFDLALRQVNVPMDAWAGLIKSAGGNHERIAARIAAASPQTDLYWAGYVAAGSSVIVNTVVSHPLPPAKAGGAPPFLNSGESFTLEPSVDRTGYVIVKLTSADTTLTTPPAGTLPRQDEQRRSYPVSLKNGVAAVLAQTTPVDATHVDVVILTATIDNR